MKHINSALAAVLALTAAQTAFAASTVYVPIGDPGQVQIIDAASNRISGVIEGLGNVHGLAGTPDGRYLVAGSLTVTVPGAAAATPPPAGMSEQEHAAHHAAPAADAKPDTGVSTVSVIDTTTRQVVRRIEVPGAVHHVAVSPNGRYAVTTHPATGGISVIDLHHYKVVASLPTGPAPNYAVFTSDGAKAYVSNAGDNTISEIDTASWSVTRSLAAGQAPEHVVLAPDDGTLYVNNVGDGTVSAIALTDGSTSATYPIGAVPHGIDLSDDGGTLFASSKAEDKLVAIDLASGNIRSKTLTPAPYHVATVHGQGTVYVSSREQKRLWVLDQETLEVRGDIALGGIGHQMVLSAR